MQQNKSTHSTRQTAKNPQPDKRDAEIKELQTQLKVNEGQCKELQAEINEYQNTVSKLNDQPKVNMDALMESFKLLANHQFRTVNIRVIHNALGNILGIDHEQARLKMVEYNQK